MYATPVHKQLAITAPIRNGARNNQSKETRLCAIAYSHKRHSALKQ